jgi:hypothetical protein
MTHKEFLDRLITVWSKFPELRFGQLIENAIYKDKYCLFSISNHDMIKALEDFARDNGK